MIVFNSTDVNFISNGTLLAYNVLHNGIIRYLRKLYCTMKWAVIVKGQIRILRTICRRFGSHIAHNGQYIDPGLSHVQICIGYLKVMTSRVTSIINSYLNQ